MENFLKKLLFVIGSLQSGGAERVASRLCSYWADENKYQVELLTGSKIETDFYPVSKLVKRTSLGFNYNECSFFSKVKEQFIRYKKIDSILKKSNCDTVVLSATDISIRFLFNLLFKKINVIVCEHNNYEALNSKFKRLMRKLLYKRANYLFVLTYRDELVYIKHGINEGKIVVMNNPLGIVQPDFISRKPSNKLLAVGRLTRQKSFERLLSIFHLLSDSFTLSIVGEGEEREKLEILADNLKLSNRVTFFGNQKDIASFYSSHDVLLMTSIYEGLPMVIGEANAFSLPVIAYDCPTGPAEMISNGQSGYLIPDGNEMEFVKKVNYLLSNDNVYSDMSMNAYNASKNQKIESITKLWNKYL